MTRLETGRWAGRWVLALTLSLVVIARAWGAAGVASAHPAATEAGIRVLERGGNAFDAAIAVTSTLAVVEPASSGLGGGGFWLLHEAASGKTVMLDGREKAPLGASRDMYLDDDGEVIPKLSIDGALAVAVPGEPAALAWLAENYGTMPLSETLAAAIDRARNGFVVTERYRRLAAWRRDLLRQYPASATIFLQQGEVPELGATIIQQDLARTLETIAAKGHAGFYAGEIANQLVHGVQQAGGILTLEDLAEYRVAVREPVVFDYQDMRITSATLPSSGGLVLAEILNILENYDLAAQDDLTALHLTVEAMRRGYRDRAEYMGDPDFVDVPIELLTNKAYAAGLSQSINRTRASRSSDLAATNIDPPKAEDTTHFSVIDHAGNIVSATLSINYPFGSGVVAPGTGVLLNDEMDDFSARPGTPNVYGLVGAWANAIEPGKRMLSSMSPTIVQTDEAVLALGTPGGSRIISMVLLGILEFAKGAKVEDIVNHPRYHHQYLPDAIQFEQDTLDASLAAELAAMGHQFQPLKRTWGNMHAVMSARKTGAVSAASDRRGEGRAMVLP